MDKMTKQSPSPDQDSDTVTSCPVVAENIGGKEIHQMATEASFKSTEMDVNGLRRVPGNIPKAAFLILVVEVSHTLTTPRH